MAVQQGCCCSVAACPSHVTTLSVARVFTLVWTGMRSVGVTCYRGSTCSNRCWRGRQSVWWLSNLGHNTLRGLCSAHAGANCAETVWLWMLCCGCLGFGFLLWSWLVWGCASQGVVLFCRGLWALRPCVLHPALLFSRLPGCVCCPPRTALDLSALDQRHSWCVCMHAHISDSTYTHTYIPPFGLLSPAGLSAPASAH